MNHRTLASWLASVALAASILACNLGNTSSPSVTDVPTGAPPLISESPTTESIAGTGACSNPYQPIVAGATWNYNLTADIPDTYTHSILTVTETGFVEQDIFGTGVTRQAEWNCEAGNLIALNPSSGGSAGVQAEGVEVDFQTTQLTGVTLPAVINPGDTWSQSLTLEGTETINGQEFPAKNELTSNCVATGIESVTVPAGTFDAMRVDCTTDMNITMNMGGGDIQATINLSSMAWYAPNVGMVKTITTGNDLDSTIELLSYSIP
jgi:hypothetical protein